MLYSCFFLTVDPHLGRLDYNLLSDQALMEMLIEGFPENVKKRYQDEHGMYKDVCEWRDVSCDADQRVVSIKKGSLRTGSIALAYIPPGVITFRVLQARVSGTLPTDKLPHSMKTFNIGRNNFDGTVNLTSLPPNLVALSIQTNVFTGSADFSHLPESLKGLWMHKNKFSGRLHLENLSERLLNLDVSNNEFTGDFYCPETLRCFVTVKGNAFNPIATLHREANISLCNCGVERVVDEEGKEHPLARWMLPREDAAHIEVPEASGRVDE